MMPAPLRLVPRHPKPRDRLTGLLVKSCGSVLAALIVGAVSWSAATLLQLHERVAVIEYWARWQGMLPALLAVLFVGFGAWAAPPENADPALAPWFKSLTQPDTGVSCCSIADCRPVDDRITPAGYEALVDGQWLPIPAERVLHRENPVGRAVLCRSVISEVIYCFIPSSAA